MEIFFPPLWCRLFFSNANWRLTLKETSAEVDDGNMVSIIDYSSVEKVKKSGTFFLTVSIRLKDRKLIKLPWLSSYSARNVVSMLVRQVGAVRRQAFNKLVGVLFSKIDTFFDRDQYICNRDFCQWRDVNSKLAKWARQAQKIWDDPLFSPPSLLPETTRKWECCQSLFYGDRTALAVRNEEYIRKEEKRHRPFFNTVESRPLTEEQRRAAIVMEDRNLLIAAAGSGKTSAVVGKIGYVLCKRIYGPSEILALAFNRNAAEELSQRINKRLSAASLEEGCVKVATFHRFGYFIIGEAEGAKPSLADWTNNMSESSKSSQKWEQMVENINARDGEFKNNFDNLWMFASRAFKPLHLFKNKNEYEQYLQACRIKKRGGAGGENWGVQTIKGEWVRSMEEATIANWLYSNSVDYEYERLYEHDVSDKHHRQYKPDFYYPDIGVYHEHFALDVNSVPPPMFGPDYAKDAQWKRDLHKSKNTPLIETTSAMFQQGDILNHLKMQLRAHGAVFKHRSSSNMSAQIRAQYIKPIYKIMHTFLTHWKSNGVNDGELWAKVKRLQGFQQLRARLFVPIMIRIRQEYENTLQDRGEIDFEDMLTRATLHLREGHWKHPYKLILVDEFQDISCSRSRLVKAMLEQNQNCKMFAVGDDWQAIYRFAGADISVMTNFASEFGITAENRLGKTFRSNQGIADVAANFVSKNPAQLSKDVKATDPMRESVVQVVNYDAAGEDKVFIKQQLEKIAGVSSHKKVKIYILARYNHHMPKEMASWKQSFKEAMDIEFATIHRVKGQEADYVFVLGLNAGEYGFPSEMEDDPVLQLVMPHPEKFEQAEERRLFYVALTRARLKVFLLSKTQVRSHFIREILEEKTDSVQESDVSDGVLGPPAVLQSCLDCGAVMKERKGAYGKFLGCSNYPKCKHTQQLPE